MGTSTLIEHLYNLEYTEVRGNTRKTNIGNWEKKGNRLGNSGFSLLKIGKRYARLIGKRY